jgi:hypothetical protein
MNYKKSIFFIIFVVLGTLALNVKLSQIAGSKVSFTLFDSLAPIAGQFLGSVGGVIAVLIMQINNLLLHGNWDPANILRIIPTLFAVVYFSSGSKWNLVVPTIAIIFFILHPIGQTVWYYSAFWLIPILLYPHRNNLLAKSLGATFSAHSVGGVLWLYFFNLPKEIWIGLIPIVIIERLLFASGITINYILINKLVTVLSRRVTHEISQN